MKRNGSRLASATALQNQTSNKQFKETTMNQSTKRTLFILLAGMLLLAACAPAPAAAPTQDPAEIQRQIQDAVAMTVQAQGAQTEQAQALIPQPTNTPLPTQTAVGVLPSPTPVIPTATPFVVVPPPTLAPPVTGGGSDPVSRDYACDIIHQRPLDNTYFKPNKSFDVKWTIINTGTKSWAAGLDLKYFSGPSMTTVTRIQLPAMAPGDQFNVVLDATSPAAEGFQVMTWVIDGQFCFPYVAINVEK
jgi:hypothetical protein